MATTAPTVDYTASVWCSLTKKGTVSPWNLQAFNPIQQCATQAIIGVYRTAALAITESEAGIKTTFIRLQKHIYHHWINNSHALPPSRPF
jgi:hypothetical protein